MNPVGCWEITVSHINCVNLLLIKLINDKTSYFSIHSSILQARSVLVFFSECSVFLGVFFVIVNALSRCAFHVTRTNSGYLSNRSFSPVSSDLTLIYSTFSDMK